MNQTLFIVLIALNVILLAAVIFVCVRYRSVYRAYDYFMRGRDAETLEDTIIRMGGQIEKLQEEDEQNKEAIRLLNKNLRASFQKFGIVHYNAFKGMGGTLSFAMALLDYTNSGFIVNSVHSRESCYVYVKTVERGTTEILLGSEEQQALEQALGYVQREQ